MFEKKTQKALTADEKKALRHQLFVSTCACAHKSTLHPVSWSKPLCDPINSVDVRHTILELGANCRAHNPEFGNYYL